MSNLAPAGWTSSKFGSLTKSIKSGLSRRIVSQDIGLPVLISGNIQNNNLDTSELKYWYVDDPQGADTSRYLLNDGDILLCFINSLAQIGKVCIYSDIGRATIYTTNLFRVVAHEDFSSSYVYQLMTNQPFQEEIQLITKPAVNQASFTKADLEEIPVIFPPLPEQKKIAAILTSVDDVIEKTQAQIDKLKDLKTGMMQDLLTRGVGVDDKPYTEFTDSPVGRIPKGWEVVKFKDIFHTYKYGPRFSSKDYDELGNVKTIRGTDLSSNGVIKYSQVPVAKLDSKLVTQNALNHGDLVMITTADCGATAVFESQSIPYIASAYAIKLTPKKGLNSKYINYFMQTDEALSQVDSFVRKGTVANLPGSDVMSMILALPPFDEQNQVVRILEKLDENITLKLEVLDSKKSLKKALMQDLLTGKKRVKVEG